MGSAVELRADYSATALRQLSRTCGDVNQSRRLLSLAAVLDGMSRTDAARIGGMDRQTLRDWVHRCHQLGPDGHCWYAGPHSRLTAEQKMELAELVETGPDPTLHGVVRWRRVDLQRVIGERFGIDYHERTIGKLLKELGFSRISARPRHPGQDARVIAEYKKRMARPVCKCFVKSIRAVCANVSGLGQSPAKMELRALRSS